MKTLFGGSSKSVSTSNSGFSALPRDIQERFTNLVTATDPLRESPEQYFTPMGLTSQEQMVGQMINPANIGASISSYLNPFRDIITQDINRQFESPASQLSSLISQAGAFGSSQARNARADLERSRLDAITRGLSDQYNNAFGQYQAGLANLLGFGGLERGIDLSQRQALPQSLQTISSIIAPLLGSGQSTSVNKGASEGIFGKLGGFMSGLGAIGVGG